MRILIVDDEMASQIIMEEILGLYGECTVANNGKEGVAAFKKAFSENKPYDLICMDIMMPEMGGHEALMAIREYEESFNVYGNGGVKIIMISSLNDVVNIQKAFIEKCESYIIKPIEKIKISGILERLGFYEQTL